MDTILFKQTQGPNTTSINFITIPFTKINESVQSRKETCLCDLSIKLYALIQQPYLQRNTKNCLYKWAVLENSNETRQDKTRQAVV